MAEQRLTLRPAFNPFKQRAGLVPVWLARRLRGIQVNMRLNKRWNSKSAAGIQDLIAFAVGLVHGRDSTKPTVLNGNLPQPFAIRYTNILHKPKRRCRHTFPQKNAAEIKEYLFFQK